MRNRLKGGAVVALCALMMAAEAHAQAYSCAVPATIAVPRPELPDRDNPRRVLPIGGYTLALTWVPQFCRDRGKERDSRFECGGRNSFGFALHGLWPEGEGATWPQYCRATGIVDANVIRRNLCATPSAQLIQHEWAKHGSCMVDRPADYFAASTALYGKLRYPDMDALSRRRLTAGSFAAALARANPGIVADMIRVRANGQGWLEEVWLCLDRGRAYAGCPAHQNGLAPGKPLKIWRGRR